MSIEDGYFQVGAAQGPLPLSANSLLQDADPALFFLLDFYAGVLDAHLSNRWDVEVAAAGRSDLVGLTVAEKLPYDPVPHLQETQFKYPLLAIYRKSEEYDWRTITWYTVKSQASIMWTLPPLTAGQTERLAPFLSFASKTIIDRTMTGLDPNVNDGYSPFKQANLESIAIKKAEFGSIPDVKTEMFLPTVIIDCEISERRMQRTDAYKPLTGIDTSLDEC